MNGVRFIGMFVQIDDHDNRILPMIMNQTEKTSIDRCRLSYGCGCRTLCKSADETKRTDQVSTGTGTTQGAAGSNYVDLLGVMREFLVNHRLSA